NLLVQPALCDLNQNRALTRSQYFESRPEHAQGFFILAARTVASESNIYSIQKILVSERLREKLDGAALHRLHGHRNVAMSGDEDDLGFDARRGEIALKIQAASPWQSHIEDQTGRAIRQFGSQKIGNRRK